MRRVFSVVLCILIIFSFCSCGSNRPFALSEFERDVSFKLGELTVKGQLNYKNKDEMSFTIKEPENVSGIVFTENEISHDEVKIGYGKMANESPVNILMAVLCDVAQKEISLPLKGEFTYAGDFSSAGYKICFNCEKSEITSIQTEKYIYMFE